jgi:hypothetical protein
MDIVPDYSNVFSLVYSDILKKIKRVLQVQTTGILVPLLFSRVNDYVTLLIFLLHGMMFLKYLKWLTFQDLLLTMIITVIIEIMTPYEQSVSQLIVLYDLSIIFLLIQFISSWVPSEVQGQVIGNIQWIYSNTLNQAFQRYFQNQIIVILIIVSFVFFLQTIHFDNQDFIILYSMAAIQSIQSLIIENIPQLFVIPSVIILLFLIQKLMTVSHIGDELYGFFIYITADQILKQMKLSFSVDVICFVSILLLFFFHYICVKTIVQIMLVIVTVDSIFSQCSYIFSADPVLFFVIFTFTIKIVTTVMN